MDEPEATASEASVTSGVTETELVEHARRLRRDFPDVPQREYLLAAEVVFKLLGKA
jgi:hypothetical protein